MKILVTGGTGFIGVNLTEQLVRLGHNVTVIDSCNPDSGYNRVHSGLLKSLGVEIIEDSIGNAGKYVEIISGSDIVFNLASLIGHMMSVEKPLYDIQENTIEHIKFLEILARCKPHKLIYTSTRQVYGRQYEFPVNETQCVNPVDFNGISKYSTELYHRVYANIYDINLTIMRITNVYGPRMYIKDNKLSFMGFFINRVITGNDIEIFGDGKQERDMLYIDDLTDTMIRSIHTDFTGIINIGGSEPYSLNSIVSVLSDIEPGLKCTRKPFPQLRSKIDLGSYCTDNSLAERTLGHKPKVDIREGLRKTVDFYRTNGEYYS